MSRRVKGLSREGETVTTDRKQTYRLYPSLPHLDRYEVCVPVSSTGDGPAEAAGDTQSEAASEDFRLKAQILILEEQRKELLFINEKWAKEYRTLKTYHKEEVEDLRALLHFREENITSCKKDGDNSSTRTVTTDVSSELQKAQTEATELRVQNRALIQKWQHQHKEIRRLNKALEDTLQTAQPLGESSETRLDVWKHQAEVYREDFLRERKDREKLNDKYLELEMKFKKVHSELRVLKPQVTKSGPPKLALERQGTNRSKCPSPNN